MVRQRPISLNPQAADLEVVKITYPGARPRQGSRWMLEPMRFIPHDGRVSEKDQLL